jgi:hypothetical protein
MAFVGACIPFFETAIIADTYDHCADEYKYTHRAFMQLFGNGAASRITFTNTQTHHDMQIESLWGSLVRTFSTDRKEGDAILGKEFDLIVLGEGSKISSDAFHRKIWRAADRRVKVNPNTGYYRRTGRVCIFTTPTSYEGCSADEFERVKAAGKGDKTCLNADKEGVDWLESVWLREAANAENPSFSKAAIAAAKKRLPSDIFEEQYLGLMRRRAGLIYKEYQPKIHDLPLPSPERIRNMRLGIGMDTGKIFSALLMGIEPDGKRWVLGEVYTKEQSISANCADLKLMLYKILGPILTDLPCEKDDEESIENCFKDLRDTIDIWRIDDASQHKEDTFELLDVAISFDQLEVLGTIDRVREWFNVDQLLIASDTTIDPDTGEGLRWELGRYAWRTASKITGSSKAVLQPVKKDDHACDALRIVGIPLDAAGPAVIDTQPKAGYIEAMEQQLHYEVIGHLVERMRRPDVRTVGEGYRVVHGNLPDM